jgi:hypothetical protein
VTKTDWTKSLKAHFERVREIREVHKHLHPIIPAIKSSTPKEIKVIPPNKGEEK